MINRFLQKKDNKVLASNYLSLLLLQAASYILPLIIIPYLVIVLGTEKFGLVMFAQSFAIFLTVFVDFGFNLSGTREISLARENKQKLSEIFAAIMISKFVLILVAFIILYVVITVFSRFSVDPNVYLLSFGIVIGQALFPVWFFQGIEKMGFVTLVNILAKVIFTLLVFVLVNEESDYIFVPLYNSLGFIVSGLLGLFLCFRYINFVWPSLFLIKRLVKESSSLFASNFAITLYTSSNVLILGVFSGDTVVGIYSSMEKLVLAIKNVYSPLYQAIYPWLAKQENTKKVEIINKMKPFVFVSGLLITLTILIFGETILYIIYDNAVIVSFVIIFKILSFIAIFAGSNMLYNTLYFPATKKYKIRMNIMIVGGLFNFFLSMILVKLYGIYGTAITVTLTEFLLLVLGFYFFKKNSKF